VTEAELNAVIAATLRTAAEWYCGGDEQDTHHQVRAELRGIADQVDQRGADEDCCVLCEEVECDDHCPYAETRSSKNRSTS